MKFEKVEYKGFVISQRVDVRSHCATIFKDGKIIKMVAGGIAKDGTNDVMSKAKLYIDQR